MPDPPLPLETMEATSPVNTGRGEAIAGGGGGKSPDPSSPEFEFWMVRNPSLPLPDLPSADELFTDGVILPLRLIHQPPSAAEPEQSPVPDPEPEPASSTLSSSASPAPSASKRWKDIFKGPNREKKPAEKETKRSTKNGPSSAAELNININIWPFSRSRSAGTGSSSRSRGVSTTTAAGRRVSSAPCSRSNSRGETCKPPLPAASAAAAHATRRGVSSPGRPAVRVPVGRASPVWQPRRPTKKAPLVASSLFRTGGVGGGTRSGADKGGGSKIISQLSDPVELTRQARCGVDNKRCSETGGEFVAAAGAAAGGGNGSHFPGIRAFFSKVF